MSDIVYQQPVILKKSITSDFEDQAGYQEIFSAGSRVFTPSDVPGLTSDDYTLRITVDGTLRSLTIALLDTDTFSEIATKVQGALRTATSKNETVQIINDKIRVTSTTLGASSSVFIQDGASDGLLAALAAITPPTGKYIPTIATASSGREGVAVFSVTPYAPYEKDFYFTGFCIDSSNKQKVGLKYTFDKATGCVTVADDGDIVELKTGDTIVLCGIFA